MGDSLIGKTIGSDPIILGSNPSLPIKRGFMNKYKDAFKEIDSIKEISLDEFDSSNHGFYSSVKSILDKEGVLYCIPGTPVILSAHSDQFQKNPNELMWYVISEQKSGKISMVDNIEESDAVEMLGEIAVEIFFYANLIRESSS